MNAFRNKKDITLVVQASRKKDIKEILIDINDYQNIIKKRYCYEIIIKDSKIKKEFLGDSVKKVIIQAFYYNSQSANLNGLNSDFSGFNLFNLADYVKTNYNYQGKHLKDILVYYFNQVYTKKFNDSLEPNFFKSRLFTTMIKQLLFEYHEHSFISEMNFCLRSSFNISLDLIGWWIGKRRLKTFQSLSYEVTRMMFYQNIKER
jgi:hypothetical protein